MDQPLVSIVMTLYNGEKFVKQAIESVLAQTYSNWELIVVDDASTDMSVDMVRSIADPRIRLIRLAENGQICNAHITGDREAKGKYIASLDKDDLWDKTKLEKQVSWMEAHPETGACFTLLRLIDQNGTPKEDPVIEKLYEAPNRSRTEWLHDLLTTGNHLAHPSVLIRKDVLFETGGYNMLFLQAQDYDLWLRILLKHDIYVIQEKLYYYRRFEGSGSISEVNDVNLRRTLFEYAWCVGHTIMDMEPALFMAVFREELKNPDAETEKEIPCEKALLLASDRLVTNCRIYAFEMFETLYRDSESICVLKEKYGFTQHNVYRMTGEPILYANGDFEEIRRLNNEVRRWKEGVDELKRSPSWRVTAPLRAVKKLIKKSKAQK